jgi:branched-chain amino acid transport system ATP-binding protein
MSVLKIENLSIQFGGLKAVDKVNIDIKQGELVGLIGPNGAGKTTIFNMLTGVYVPTDGNIFLNGEKITGKKPNEIVLLGSSRTFQNIRLFKNMTVLDNIKIAYHNHMTYHYFDTIFKTPKYVKEEQEANDYALSLLKVFNLEEFAYEKAKNLPYGAQRKLEIARALATKPEVLLLDEPAAGMNPTETEMLMNTIRKIKKDFDISVLLIEHDMKLVMGICERIYVVDYGKVIANGTPEDIRRNPNVIKAYLGE